MCVAEGGAEELGEAAGGWGGACEEKTAEVIPREIYVADAGFVGACEDTEKHSRPSIRHVVRAQQQALQRVVLRSRVKQGSSKTVKQGYSNQ